MISQNQIFPGVLLNEMKAALSKKEKIILIDKILKSELFEINVGLCSLISWDAPEKVGDLSPTKILPELLYYKPQKISKSGYWWPCEDRIIRKKVLETILFNLNQSLENKTKYISSPIAF